MAIRLGAHLISTTNDCALLGFFNEDIDSWAAAPVGSFARLFFARRVRCGL